MVLHPLAERPVDPPYLKDYDALGSGGPAAWAHRGRGVGSALFGAAESWAAARGCTELKVETQDINVRACRFYEARGCRLRAIDRATYPGLDEVQMLWYRALA